MMTLDQGSFSYPVQHQDRALGTLLGDLFLASGLEPECQGDASFSIGELSAHQMKSGKRQLKQVKLLDQTSRRSINPKSTTPVSTTIPDVSSDDIADSDVGETPRLNAIFQAPERAWSSMPRRFRIDENSDGLKPSAIAPRYAAIPMRPLRRRGQKGTPFAERGLAESSPPREAMQSQGPREPAAPRNLWNYKAWE